MPATVSPEPDPRGASVPRGAGVPAGAVGRAGDYWDFSRARVVAEREVQFRFFFALKKISTELGLHRPWVRQGKGSFEAVIRV